MTDLHLPDGLADYLVTRDRQRSDQVAEVLGSLTPIQRALIREAAVMGYVQGARAPSSAIPPDSDILHIVIASCLDMPDMYPAISGRHAGEAGRG